MATDQERQQAVDALLIRLREETESAVRGFVNDVVVRADADRRRALDEARQAADAAVQAAVDAAQKDVRAEIEGAAAARLREAQAEHAARVVALEAKLTGAREQAEAERVAAVAGAREQAEAERVAAVAEAREQAEAERAAAVAETRTTAEAERARALAEARERAGADQAAALAEAREAKDAERARALAEAREKADAERAAAVERVRQEAAAEQVAALSQARKEAAEEQAEALSRVRREAAVAQAEAVARAQEAAAQTALAANAGGALHGTARAGVPSGAAATDEDVRLALDSGYPVAGPDPGGEAAEDAARVSQVLDAIRQLDEQTTVTSLLESLTDRAAAYASRAALFVRVAGEMRGWRFTGFEGAGEGGGTQALNGAGGFLGRAIDEGRALVLTPPPGEDELDWPPAFADLPPDRSAIAVPVAIGGQPMVALYADDARRAGPSTPAAWSDAIELLARHAGCCIEALTANHAAGLLPTASPAPSDP